MQFFFSKSTLLEQVFIGGFTAFDDAQGWQRRPYYLHYSLGQKFCSDEVRYYDYRDPEDKIETDILNFGLNFVYEWDDTAGRAALEPLRKSALPVHWDLLHPYIFEPMFPLGEDTTGYKLVSRGDINIKEFHGKDIVTVDPLALPGKGLGLSAVKFIKRDRIVMGVPK
jgi:hypothetical protein